VKAASFPAFRNPACDRDHESPRLVRQPGCATLRRDKWPVLCLQVLGPVVGS
jgi:hypothetical protein